jgi:phage FluMu protein Com
LFAHDEFCPWGTRLSLVCPQCNSENSWSKPTKEGSMITMSCKGSRKGKACTKKRSFQKPDGMRSLGVDIGGGKSAWPIHTPNEYMVGNLTDPCIHQMNIQSVSHLTLAYCEWLSDQ